MIYPVASKGAKEPGNRLEAIMRRVRREERITWTEK